MKTKIVYTLLTFLFIVRPAYFSYELLFNASPP